MTEKLNIKVFLGDSQTPEDFSLNELSTNTSSSFPTTSNDIFFSSNKTIPFQFIDSQNRTRFLTNNPLFYQTLKPYPVVTEENELRTTFNNNIITILYFLFPAFYNSIPNIHNSFDDKVPHSDIPKINAPVLNRNKTVATTENGLVYYKGNTVVQLTWKNDVFNVPEFQQLFSDIYAFYVWSKTQGKQVVNSGLNKIVENLMDPRNGILNNLEKASKRTVTDISTDEKEILDNIIKIKGKYNELKGLYDNRKKIAKDKTTPVDKAEQERKNYEEQQEKIIMEISENIVPLKNFNDTYNQNVINYSGSRSSTTSVFGSIVKNIIESFKSLITNRSVLDLIERNEYIFKTNDPLPKFQQELYDYLNKYPEYTRMGESVEKFRKSVFKTSNPELDRLCNDFFNNTNRNLLYFILYIQKNFLYSTRGKPVLEDSFKNVIDEIAEQGSNSSKLYYVGGITQNGNKNLLIYIGLDVIRGKVTTINQEKVKKCLYSNEKLGNIFMELMETNNRATVKNYFYDVIADGSLQISETRGLPQPQPQPQQQNGSKQGGKTRKHVKRIKRQKKLKGFKKTSKKHLRRDNGL